MSPSAPIAREGVLYNIYLGGMTPIAYSDVRKGGTTTRRRENGQIMQNGHARGSKVPVSQTQR